MSGPTITFAGVAKWYGDTVAVAELAITVHPGVTGLLGHNGAGKSTALKLAAGFARASAGTVRVLGVDPATDRSVHTRLGVVTDRDAMWPFLTAREFVTLAARLRDVTEPEAAADRAIALVAMGDAAERRVAGFSKGMRQRVKLAAALVHDPDVLLLDEPLNGLDPVQRRETVALVRALGDAGRTIVVSSHVLHEVERMADRMLVLVNGRLVAEGATRDIRALLADRPRRIRINAGNAGRALANRLVADDAVASIAFDGDAITIETEHAERFALILPVAARAANATLLRVEPVDDDLESVYAYLQLRARGG